ncbi:MAG: aminotransferase class V-fold PLP-dependent enzyme [Verrucomicrobia bacterium]|jgi:cysteine desulfurase|nr:aminotransferase class V-fold PLP-dependent enzyme [Verrucomicrobiota bacterium]
MRYFDWNATAPVLPEAFEAYRKAAETSWANPSTAYRAGARARNDLERARERMRALCRFPEAEVVFTSGATEAINGYLRSMARAEGSLLLSPVEHPAVTAAAQACWGRDRIEWIPSDANGRARMDRLQERLRDPARPPALVCLMAVNNETGVKQPWAEAAELCRGAGVPFFCDSVQWMGKEPPDGLQTASAVTVSGHKFGAPRGVGALLLRRGDREIHLQHGGEQELGMRAGTENVPAVLAMVRALEERAASGVPDPEGRWRDAFEGKLRAAFGGEVVLHGEGAPRIWNTSSLALPNLSGPRWIAKLDRRGFAVSSGSACSTGKEGPSPVLAAMGVPEAIARRTLRVSSGWETTAEDWDSLAEAILALHGEGGNDADRGGGGMVIDIS